MFDPDRPQLSLRDGLCHRIEQALDSGEVRSIRALAKALSDNPSAGRVPKSALQRFYNKEGDLPSASIDLLLDHFDLHVVDTADTVGMIERGEYHLPLQEKLIRYIDRAIEFGVLQSVSDLEAELQKKSKQLESDEIRVPRASLYRFYKREADLHSAHVDVLMWYFSFRVFSKQKPGTVLARKLVEGEDGLKRLGTITTGESKPAPTKKRSSTDG